MCIYTNNVFLGGLRYKAVVLPGTLLPGSPETRQDDQGPVLRGVAVPEQPGPQEPHTGHPTPSTLLGRGPPALLGLQPRPERGEQGEKLRERRQEQGAFGSTPGSGERPRAAGRPQPEGGPESPEEAAGRGGRRLRTAFSAEQIGTLESSFQRHRYLGAAERRKLAGRMRLSEVQVSTWFQNRRMKLKRQLQELRPEAFCGAPLPYGPQSGVVSLPLTCAAPPPALPRQEAAPGGFALAALPAPTLDLSSACRAQPVSFPKGSSEGYKHRSIVSPGWAEPPALPGLSCGPSWSTVSGRPVLPAVSPSFLSVNRLTRL
uniref:VENT homeobox n=1 Tax=Anser brachyrhynchus TaxID=132585 RepID=A0A8B9HYA2_9AVES